jgi:hypothetical protein
MFTQTRIIGVVTAGSLQPSTIQIVGDWACPSTGANSGIDLELEVTSPNGHPTTAFTATTNNGTNGPVGSVTFTVPGWSVSVCGIKFAYRVRGLCGGAWTAWQTMPSTEIDCGGCPRIQMNAPSYAACTGNPPTQDVTLSAVIMLPPGQSSSFTWDFGDGNTAGTGAITNNTGNPNTPLNVSVTHTYQDRAAPYVACLRPPANSECPSVCVDVQTTCSSVGCPAITAAVSYDRCNPNGSRPTTYTLTFNPPVPANSSLQVSWAYGGPNANGVSSETQTVSTSAGAVSNVTWTTNLAHRAGGYNTTATVVVLIGGQLCPIATSTVTIQADPQPCLPCPLPGNPITVSIGIPTQPTWCAPMTAPLAATFTAQVNWQAPAPTNPPAPVRYDWTVTGPGGTTATQQGGASVTTASGWTGPLATAGGGINLGAAGTYTVSAAAVFSASSGLPTDATGAVSCTLVGGATFTLQACRNTGTCPTVTGLTVNSLTCADRSTGATGNLSITAVVNDPGGTAQSFEWDFGDPGAPGNQITTATPNATHSYAAPGIYVVAVTVRSSDPNCPPNGSARFAASITVNACTSTPPPPPGGGGGGGGSVLGCAILLLISMVLMLAGTVVGIVGACVGNPYVIIAGVAILVVGLILFIFWALFCAGTTACSLMRVVHCVLFTLVAVVLPLLTVILAILAFFGITSIPCAVSALVSWGYWGAMYAWLGFIMRRVGCAPTC